jgi:hypothetical protein
VGFPDAFAALATGLFALASTVVLVLMVVVVLRFLSSVGGGLKGLFSRRARVEARYLVFRGPHYPKRYLRVRRWIGVPPLSARRRERWGR